MKQIIRDSIIAGFFIGIGCIINLSCQSKVLGSLLFSLGLISVILQSRWLFTGKIGFIKSKADIVPLLVCVVTNLLSIGLLCWAFKFLGNLPIDTTALCEAKMNETWYEALVRAIGCGMLMYVAVRGYKESKSLISVILPVMVFILCGFDHCIANYGYLAVSGIFWCWQLPIWIIGNAIGSLIISKI